MCGGTRPTRSRRPMMKGLSPRVRGNLELAGHHQHRLRSIPACAGEPAEGEAGSCIAKVYPRVCGGTSALTIIDRGSKGLSPRVRGNPPRAALEAARGRSIPACAGEPGITVSATSRNEVYPRVCGGTAGARFADCTKYGLSPRVRGNPGCPDGRRCLQGSIPACAGEP